MSPALPAGHLGLARGPLLRPGQLHTGTRRPPECRGQGLCHGRHQHHQGVAPAQPAVCGRAADVPRPLRPRGPVPPGRLRRQPDHLHQDPAPGGPGGHGPVAAHGKGPGPAQQRTGTGARPAEDPPQRRRTDAQAAAGVLAARTAQGDPEGAGSGQGRPHGGDRQVQGPPRKAETERRGRQACRRRDGQDVHAGDGLPGVRRHPQLPGLDHPAPLGGPLAGQAGPQAGQAHPRPRPLRPGRRQDAHPGVPGRGHPQGRGLRLHHPAGGPARGGQDLHRPVHRRRPGPALLPLLPGRDARRGRDQGPPAHLHRGHAGQVPPGGQGRRDRQPRDHARRDRQDRRLLPRRPRLGPAGGPGPGAERRFPRPLPGPALRPVQGPVCLHRQPVGQHPGPAA